MNDNTTPLLVAARIGHDAVVLIPVAAGLSQARIGIVQVQEPRTSPGPSGTSVWSPRCDRAAADLCRVRGGLGKAPGGGGGGRRGRREHTGGSFRWFSRPRASVLPHFLFFGIFGKNGEFAARLDPRAPRGGWRSGGGARAGSEGAVAPPTIADLASFSGTERDVRKMSDLLPSRHRRVLLRSGRGPALGTHPGASRALDD